MKIGILTFHKADNYGAVLQAYALKSYLESLGHRVSVIDYSPKSIVDDYRWFKLKYWISPSPKKLFYKLLNEPFYISLRRKRHIHFEKFREQVLSLSSINKDDLSFGYDRIVIGSDQVWTPGLTGGEFDPIFFGAGLKCKSISYAASSKLVEITENQKEILKSLFENLDAISVRENGLVSIFQPFTTKRVYSVLDPTLIVDSSLFLNLSIKPKLDFKYVCIYEITPHKEVKEIAQDIADQIGAKVIEVSSHIRYTKDKSVKMNSSVGEFLGFLLNSICVITTSFHGLALSIKNNLDFYAVKVNDNNDNRLQNLLTICGLEDRFISINMSPSFKSINYDHVNDKLNNEIVKSQTFLINALEE